MQSAHRHPLVVGNKCAAAMAAFVVLDGNGVDLNGLRRLPVIFLPAEAGLAFVFKEGWQEHSELCDCQSDTEGGR